MDRYGESEIALFHMSGTLVRMAGRLSLAENDRRTYIGSLQCGGLRELNVL